MPVKLVIYRIKLLKLKNSILNLWYKLSVNVYFKDLCFYFIIIFLYLLVFFVLIYKFNVNNNYYLIVNIIFLNFYFLFRLLVFYNYSFNLLITMFIVICLLNFGLSSVFNSTYVQNLYLLLDIFTLIFIIILTWLISLYLSYGNKFKFNFSLIGYFLYFKDNFNIIFIWIYAYMSLYNYEYFKCINIWKCNCDISEKRFFGNNK